MKTNKADRRNEKLKDKLNERNKINQELKNIMESAYGTFRHAPKKQKKKRKK